MITKYTQTRHFRGALKRFIALDDLVETRETPHKQFTVEESRQWNELRHDIEEQGFSLRQVYLSDYTGVTDGTDTWVLVLNDEKREQEE